MARPLHVASLPRAASETVFFTGTEITAALVKVVGFLLLLFYTRAVPVQY